VGAKACCGASPLSIGRAVRRRGRADDQVCSGRSPVGVGDYFHQMTVGVVEIDAATAVQMIPIKETRGGLWKLWATSA
jgi:hypothetical protein